MYKMKLSPTKFFVIVSQYILMLSPRLTFSQALPKYGCHPGGKNPSLQPCDSTSPCLYELGLYCNQGQCDCPKNGLFSMARCACASGRSVNNANNAPPQQNKIKAGGHGCESSLDCIDGAHCFHQTREHTSCGLIHCHRQIFVDSRGRCDCCKGNRDGLDDGTCLPATPEECSKGERLNQNIIFVALLIAIRMCWMTIL